MSQNPKEIKEKKLLGFPIRTFNPDKLLEEMLNADNGTIFLLGEKRIPQHEGDDLIELTLAEIKKSKFN